MEIISETNGIVYKILSKKELNQTIDLIAKVFAENEYTTIGLNISQNEFLPYAEGCCKKAIAEHISVIGIDKKTGKVVAFSINEDLMSERIKFVNLCDKFSPVLEILENLKKNYLTIRNSLNISDCFHFLLVGSARSYRGRGIAKNAFKFSCHIAKDKHFKFGLVEATGPVTQYFCQHYGFKKLGEIRYKDFVFARQKPFINIKGSDGCYLYLKIY